MKKRIFITAHYLEIGGAETSLIGMLNAIDYTKYEVDLFLQSIRGELVPFVPKEVNILPEIPSYSMIEVPIKEVIKKGHLLVAAARLLAKFHFKLYALLHRPKDGHTIFDYLNKYVVPVWPSLKYLGEYDLAINYIALHNIVLQKVNAKKKIGWIHTDYSQVDVNRSTALPLWSGYDYIASISDDVSKTFISVFPELEKKIVKIENMLSPAFVRQRADMGKAEEYDHNGLVLCSVGRISYPKNYDNIPYMALRLKEMGLRFHWYIIGPGDHSSIDALSEQLGVDDAVIFLGGRENPYPYLKDCDIYVHPSRYEGKSVVVRESQMLLRPVIITNYPTAKSQINDGVDGVICELDNDKIAEAIFELANNAERRQSISDYLDEHDYGFTSEIEKLYKLL